MTPSRTHAGRARNDREPPAIPATRRSHLPALMSATPRPDVPAAAPAPGLGPRVGAEADGAVVPTPDVDPCPGHWPSPTALDHKNPHLPTQPRDRPDQRRRADPRRDALPRAPDTGRDHARCQDPLSHSGARVSALQEGHRRADRVLPNGWCMLPQKQVCSRGNACLTCDKFVTDASHHDKQWRPRRPAPEPAIARPPHLRCGHWSHASPRTRAGRTWRLPTARTSFCADPWPDTRTAQPLGIRNPKCRDLAHRPLSKASWT